MTMTKRYIYPIELGAEDWQKQLDLPSWRLTEQWPHRDYCLCLSVSKHGGSDAAEELVASIRSALAELGVSAERCVVQDRPGHGPTPLLLFGGLDDSWWDE